MNNSNFRSDGGACPTSGRSIFVETESDSPQTVSSCSATTTWGSAGSSWPCCPWPAPSSPAPSAPPAATSAARTAAAAATAGGLD